VVAPDEEFAGKQVDKGHRQHIAEHADQIGRQGGQAHAQPDRNGTTQFNDRHHRDKKHHQIILEHPGFSLL